MLQAFAGGDQNEIRIWAGEEVDRLIQSEIATRADGSIDYYGYQNE